MAQARVVVLNEVHKGREGEWNLCFQYCRYEYGDNTEELGYRFIWRRPNGNLQGARGQARIPSVADALSLIGMAIRAGWGHHLETESGHDYSDEDEGQI